MKKLSWFAPAAISALLVSCNSHHKESDLPLPVKEAFEKTHPGIKGDWEKEDGNYEVSFEKKDKEMSMVMDEKGTLLESETEIPVEELPAATIAYMKEQHPSSKIEEASKITDNKGAISYEVDIKGKELMFDQNGLFLKEAKD